MQGICFAFLSSQKLIPLLPQGLLSYITLYFQYPLCIITLFVINISQTLKKTSLSSTARKK